MCTPVEAGTEDRGRLAAVLFSKSAATVALNASILIARPAGAALLLPARKEGRGIPRNFGEQTQGKKTPDSAWNPVQNHQRRIETTFPTNVAVQYEANVALRQ